MNWKARQLDHVLRDPPPPYHRCPKCGVKALALWNHAWILAKCENCGHKVLKGGGQ